MARCPRPAALGALPLALLLAVGCDLENPGLDPPRGGVHFPLGIALVDPPEGAPLLLVANSNFDASYNAGTLQVWDRAVLEGLLATCAPTDPEDPTSRAEDCPRPLEPTTTQALRDEVRIPSVAWDVTVGPAGDRLYIAVEGREGDVTHVDFDGTGQLAAGDGYLDCGQVAGGRCSRLFEKARRGLADARDLDRTDDQKSLVVGPATAVGLPPEAGTFVLVAQRRGTVGLYVDRGTVPGLDGFAEHPTLLDQLGPVTTEIVELAFDPGTGLAWLANPDTRRPDIQRVGVAPDPDGLDAPKLFSTTPVSIRGAGATAVMRDFAFPRAGGADSVALLSGTDAGGTGTPAVFFGAPPSEATGIFDVRSLVPVCGGPSRIERAELVGRELLFVSCFNGRRVDVVDAATELQITSLREAGGVYDIAVDGPGERLWIGDFEASTIRVADLAPLARCIADELSGDRCEPRLLGSLGVPTRSSEL